MRKFLQSWKSWSNYFGEFYDASAQCPDDVVACAVFSAPSLGCVERFPLRQRTLERFSRIDHFDLEIKHQTSNIKHL